MMRRQGGRQAPGRLVALLFLLLLVGGATGAAAQDYPLITGDLEATTTAIEPGGILEIAGSGFQPGATVTITLESDPVLLATTQADGAGSIATVVSIPPSTPPGQHTVKATGAAPDGGVLVLTVDVEVAGEGLARTGQGVLLALIAFGGLVTGGTTLLLVGRRRR